MFSIRNDKYYFQVNLDAKGTLNSYMDIYNKNMKYQYSYKFPRIDDRKPISFNIDKNGTNKLYVLYQDIKKIFIYEL